MALHTFKSIQKIPITIDEAWDFLSDPKNLAVITPEHLKFTTLSGNDRQMFPGQIIHYTVKPLLGIKMEWVTEITHVTAKSFFVDEQRVGPYKLWHHKHFLTEIAGGVEMEDIVHYQLPLGFIGDLFHGILVKPRIHEIFDFRRRKLIELYGSLNE
ncbi:MAG TPA: SRPBCC family protein [Flavobacterium sp.]|jgi:ligand-binding SRPBCC domain-containing protein